MENGDFPLHWPNYPGDLPKIQPGNNRNKNPTSKNLQKTEGILPDNVWVTNAAVWIFFTNISRCKHVRKIQEGNFGASAEMFVPSTHPRWKLWLPLPEVQEVTVTPRIFKSNNLNTSVQNPTNSPRKKQNNRAEPEPPS